MRLFIVGMIIAFIGVFVFGYNQDYIENMIPYLSSALIMCGCVGMNNFEDWLKDKHKEESKMTIHEKLHQRIIKKIILLNPFLMAEESDAASWNKLCKENLIKAYSDYVESEQRLKKITERMKKLRS